MLKEVFKTVPIPYWKIGDEKKYGINALFFSPNVLPWIENIRKITGVHVGKELEKHQTPVSPHSIYVFTLLNTVYIPSWGFGFYRFDGSTGTFVRRMPRMLATLGGIQTMGSTITSRKGVLYAISNYQDTLFKISLGKTAEALVGEEPKVEDEDGWTTVAEGENSEGVLTPDTGYPITRFDDYNDSGGHLFGFGVGGSCAIDDTADFYLDASTNKFRVFTWKEGTFRYEMELPESVVSLALEDNSRCYIFMRDRTVMLFDYVRAEVLGAARMPPLASGKSYWNTTGVYTAWDSMCRRILVVEHTPNNPDGSCTVCVRGFRIVESPVRLTTPIPLKVPRRGRTFPVLVQVVGDRNEGVGGYAVAATVKGAGSLLGMPITDHAGNALIQVACEGSPLFSLSGGEGGSSSYPSDPSGISSLLGSITVVAKVQMQGLSKYDRPGGIPSVPPPSVIHPEPGPPDGGGGGEGGQLPSATAPNMQAIVQMVFDAGTTAHPSGKWDLSDGNKYNSNGGGAFTGAAVTAMHDIDARFGHVRKTGGTQYNGHAVDATNFKRADGRTEIYDFIRGSDGAIVWQYVDSHPDYSQWYY